MRDLRCMLGRHDWRMYDLAAWLVIWACHCCGRVTDRDPVAVAGSTNRGP
jgi:hypothetical protein